MARTWLSIRVELLGGRGEDLWPWPGRVFLVGPTHTFAQLAEAIDVAFARWDRGHLCQFTLADGTVVTDGETGLEATGSPFGPIGAAPLVLERTRVLDRLQPGDEFKYLFDFGDDWTHACTVEAEKVDPREVLGGSPKAPVAVWGWGLIPDQYGRRWERDGSDEPAPGRPRAPHPMRDHGWPALQPLPLDQRELSGAAYRGDVAAIVAAIEGRDIDDALQQVGIAVQVALEREPDRVEAIAVSVLNRLSLRNLPGDDVLREDLLAQLRDTPVAGRRVPVDLSEVAEALHGDPLEPEGALDLVTGEVYPGALLDEAMVGDDAVDVESEPDRWLTLIRFESRDGWNDMAEFAARQTDPRLRGRLEAALEGKGAFRRFRDAAYDEGVIEQWRLFGDDRAIGRARAYLAEQGVRACPRTS